MQAILVVNIRDILLYSIAPSLFVTVKPKYKQA